MVAYGTVYLEFLKKIIFMKVVHETHILFFYHTHTHTHAQGEDYQLVLQKF